MKILKRGKLEKYIADFYTREIFLFCNDLLSRKKGKNERKKENSLKNPL